MTENRVEVLCPGMIRRDGPTVLEAHSTATLVSRGQRRMLVDTSSPMYRERLLQALAAKSIGPEDIEVVVLTHMHHDHTGNVGLFPNAVIYVHELESPGSGIMRINKDMELWDGVSMMHTPGHTRGSMSVLVRAERRYAMAGDAIPTQDNVRKWVPPGMHYDKKAAMDSLSRLVSMADTIVPGHGPAFETNEQRTVI
ncbi:MAG: MBL fold metallo-hydrolase [Methanomassiliicoccales archaeon]|nr:MBL fold metallo-hydrolase [Methanomassiliicoccales archaeon]